eukprot:6485303-Alexandrium_andersonii.AAC.1
MLPHLAAAVPRWWAERKRLGPALPVERLASDVRDLLRQDGELMLRVLAAVPAGGVLLIAGGSPCQQFSTMGRGRGS